MEKTAEFIIMEWFTEYRKANNLTNIQYVDVNDLLLFLARNHASQFKHPVPANKSIADLNHIVINACMNLYAITEKHDEIDKIINAVKSFTNAHPVPASQPAVPQQPVDLDDENFPTYEQIGGGKDWDEMTELENAYYKIGKLKTALTVSKNTINRHKKHPVPDEAGLYSRKQLEDAHIVGYRKGRLADKDSDSVYQDAKNYAATIHPSQPEGDGWVSVEDRLPAIPPPYYEDGCKITPTGVQILVYDSLENYVYEDSYSGEFSNSYITHWQPLPSPPNK